MTTTEQKIKTIHSELAELYKETNRKLTVENNALKAGVRILENTTLQYKSRVRAADEEREAMYDAIRILADQVSRTSAAGRKARQQARNLLEQYRVRPPLTLGASRVVKKRRRKKKDV